MTMVASPAPVQANLYFLGPRNSGKTLLKESIRTGTVPHELTPAVLSSLAESNEAFLANFPPTRDYNKDRLTTSEYLLIRKLSVTPIPTTPIQLPPYSCSSPVQFSLHDLSGAFSSSIYGDCTNLPSSCVHNDSKTNLQQAILDSLRKHDQWPSTETFTEIQALRDDLFIPSAILICIDISSDQVELQKLLSFYTHQRVLDQWRIDKSVLMDFWLIGCKSDLRNKPETGKLLTRAELETAAKQAGFMGYREVSALQDLESVESMLKDVALQARIRVAESVDIPKNSFPFMWWELWKVGRKRKSILGS